MYVYVYVVTIVTTYAAIKIGMYSIGKEMPCAQE